ncbi:biopolymer transporter ExbD [bacterium]|nr:biopolymer transporter ExbD [bacterium]
MIVYIDSKGKMFFNDIAVTMDTLVPAIKKMVGRNKQQTVFVRADKSVQYGNVIKIVDHIKVVGGVDYVALATQSPARA